MKTPGISGAGCWNLFPDACVAAHAQACRCVVGRGELLSLCKLGRKRKRWRKQAWRVRVQKRGQAAAGFARGGAFACRVHSSCLNLPVMIGVPAVDAAGLCVPSGFGTSHREVSQLFSGGHAAPIGISAPQGHGQRCHDGYPDAG